MGPVTATGLPNAVTNRIFSVTIQLDGKNLSLFSNELVVRPLLMAAVDDEFESFSDFCWSLEKLSKRSWRRLKSGAMKRLDGS